MDGNLAMINFILDCPTVKDNPLFFNFGKAEDSNIQFITKGNDTILHKPFIDGSISKQYSFTLYIYKAVTDEELAKIVDYVDENVEDTEAVQAVIDWINEQNDLRNYPNFGDKYVVDEMTVTTENPVYGGTDTSVSPAIAQYSFTVNVSYIDNNKKLWEA